MRKKISLIFLFIVTTSVMTPLVSAHELIPKEAIEYIKEHPNATVEEIQQFMEEKAPGYSKKFKDKQDAVAVITNQESSFFDTIKDFFVLGIKHILEGIDHVLFLVALLLSFVSLREIIKLTGAFTIAHTITLLLAGASVLTVSTKIVEPLIAFSIAYVAITTVFLKNTLALGKSKYKLATVFFFGLFHGLGFAGILQEIQIPKDRFFSSLISFNLGIEVGQIVIIAAAFPVIYFLRKKIWYGTFIKVVAAIISMIAIFWGFERILS